MAPGAVQAGLADRTESAYAVAGSLPARSPSKRSPTSAMVLPCNNSFAHKFSPMRWLATCLTSHSVHGVGSVHWLGCTAAMTALVACMARTYSSPLVATDAAAGLMF